MTRQTPITHLKDVNIKSGFRVGGTEVTASAAELNILDGVTATAAELNKAAGVAAGAYPALTAEATFTETAGAGTYTGSVSLPAGATLLDIIINGVALWDNSGTAALTSRLPICWPANRCLLPWQVVKPEPISQIRRSRRATRRRRAPSTALLQRHQRAEVQAAHG